MFNFLKKKPIKIEFLLPPDRAYVNEYAPINRASRFIPDWFKNAPKSSREPLKNSTNTVRGCIGIINSMTTGFVLPMWSDLDVELSENGVEYYFTDERSQLNVHSKIQAPGFYQSQTIVKLECPWVVRTSKPLKFILTPCLYHHNEPLPYTIMPGIHDTTGSSNVCMVNVFIAFDDRSKMYQIPHGMPIYHIIPLTEEPYVFETKVVSLDEWLGEVNKLAISFTNPLKGLKGRKIIRSRCPFRRDD